jgi:uncharacterized protein (TIGR02246 family)
MTLPKVCFCVAALTSILTFTGCQTAAPPEQKADVAADIKAINAFRGQFAAAYDSNDAAAVAAFYANDATLMPPNQAAIEGRQGIQAMLEAYFKENAAKIAHAPLETQVAGNWAYERGNATVTVTPKSGKPREESIKYLVILKRQPDGFWKLHLDMDNSNLKTP